MRLSDLFEKNLRLRKQATEVARGGYGAFVAVMSPDDFIRLTTSGRDEYDRIVSQYQSRIFDKDKYDELYGRNGEFGRYEMPFLKVEFPSGRIVGHEGRHRAAMVMANGATSFPVMIYPYSDTSYSSVIRYTDGEDTGEQVFGPFQTYEEAEIALEEFIEAKEETSDFFYVDSRSVDVHGGATLKGGPDSKPSEWQYTKWKVEDFPEQLIGQFNPSVRVTKFRVGVVKGYRHQT